MSRKLTYFFKSTKDPQNLTHEEQSSDLNEVCPPSITENTINCDDIEDKIFQPTKPSLSLRQLLEKERDHVNQTGLKSSHGCITIKGMIDMIHVI